MIPLYDSNPRNRIPFQYVTVAFIGACVLVFVWQASLGGRAGAEAIYGLGAIPAVVLGSKQLSPELTLVPAWLTLFTSMFMHGGFMHLAGNMLFLWVLGDNVEDAMGHGRFAAFYVLCGVAAAGAHILQDPSSTVPMVGASGAISGVVGAYLVLHPLARIHTLIFYFIVALPAWIVLGLWIGFQVLNGLATMGSQAGGVAFWAHVGGAVAGLILVPFFRQKDVPLLDGLWGRGAAGGTARPGEKMPRGIEIRRVPKKDRRRPWR